MYYVGTLFISKFPFAFEEQRIVNGVEQTCLVIPCDAGQMERTRYGAWFCRLRCNIVPPNPQQRVLSISLGYKNMNELDKAERMGYLNTSRNLGYLFVASEDDESKKLDKTNNMIPILCEGRLFLDSISSEDIKTDQRTGRKYVNVTFRKSRLLDAFGNSHEFVVKTDYGEHQIGVARQIDIEPSPVSQDMMDKRDERTVEQRCVVADRQQSQKTTDESVKNSQAETTRDALFYDSFEW